MYTRKTYICLCFAYFDGISMLRGSVAGSASPRWRHDVMTPWRPDVAVALVCLLLEHAEGWCWWHRLPLFTVPDMQGSTLCIEMSFTYYGV